MALLLIFLGGGVGSVCRYGLAGLINEKTHAFPMGTLIVNVLGCIVIGVLARQFLNMQSDAMARAALMTGFCGGFTTFSTFSYETVGMITGGQYAKAALYLGASVIACIAGTAIAVRGR
jgi:CrcB protein